MKIVIADSHLITREGIKVILKSKDFKIVSEANNIRTLLGEIEKHQPDVVILDFYLPGFFSLEDIGTIYKKFPKVKILIITTNTNKKDILQVLNYGINNYILKHCEKEELVNAVYATARGEKFFCVPALEAIMEKHLPHKKKQGSTVLSVRETEIIRLIAKGFTNLQIGEMLLLSIHTVSTHRKNILKKLNLKNTPGIMMYAIENGIITYEDKKEKSF